MSVAEMSTVRTLAYGAVYLLPAADDSSEKGAKGETLPQEDTIRRVEALAPVDQQRMYRIALRRLVFQVLYQIDLGGIEVWSAGGGSGGGGTDMKAVRKLLETVHDLGPAGQETAATMIEGTLKDAADADTLFGSLSPEWSVARMSPVDRAILRLAYHELGGKSGVAREPAAIVINEAVELSKHYSTEKAPAFVNALLDNAAKAKVGGVGGGVGAGN